MNVRAVAKVAGIKVATLNQWIGRGYVRGLEVGISGKRRDINPTTALEIAIFAEMTRFGLSSDEASLLVPRDDDPLPAGLIYFRVPPGDDPSPPDMPRPHGDWLIVLRPGTEVFQERHRLQGALVVRSESLAGFEKDVLEKLTPAAAALVIHIPTLAARVRAAEQEWQESHGGKQPDG
jgi:hypothetical protein